MEKGLYCVKCRDYKQPSKLEHKEIKFTRKKSGKEGCRHCVQGECPTCKTNMKRFISQTDVGKYSSNSAAPQ